MEFRAELHTNYGMALMKRVASTVRDMECVVKAAEESRDSAVARYETSVADRVELRKQLEERDELIRDLWALADEMYRLKRSPSINTMAEFEERLEEFGIEVGR